jgi:hypothetical protein
VLGEPISLERDVVRWDRFVEAAAEPEALEVPDRGCGAGFHLLTA